MRPCLDCSKELVRGSNWTESNEKHRRYICRSCQKERTRAWKAKHPGIQSVYSKVERERAPERVAERRAKYARGKGRETQKVWCDQNPEKLKAYADRWRTQNPSKMTEKSARRRAVKRSQTPANADASKIAAFYDLAISLTKATGQPYHVDHVQSLASGGLHHEDNLVVMTAALNLSKGTQSWPWLTWFNEHPA